MLYTFPYRFPYPTNLPHTNYKIIYCTQLLIILRFNSPGLKPCTLLYFPRRLKLLLPPLPKHLFRMCQFLETANRHITFLSKCFILSYFVYFFIPVRTAPPFIYKKPQVLCVFCFREFLAPC